MAERQAYPSVRYSGSRRSPAGIEAYRAHQRARQRALHIVARMHSDEFAALWLDRRRWDSPGYDARKARAERAVARNHPEDLERVFAAEKRREGL
jgi:hypothetical protein